MKIDTIRILVGFGTIIWHFGLLVFVGVLASLGKFTTDEMFSLWGIIAPLFAAYTTVTVRYYLALGTESSSDFTKSIPTPTAIISIFIPNFFSAIVALGIIWKAYSSLGFGDLVQLIGIAETLLGVYVGMVVERYFGSLDGKNLELIKSHSRSIVDVLSDRTLEPELAKSALRFHLSSLLGIDEFKEIDSARGLAHDLFAELDGEKIDRDKYLSGFSDLYSKTIER